MRDAARSDAAGKGAEDSQIDVAVQGEVQLSIGRQDVSAAGNAKLVVFGAPPELLDLCVSLVKSDLGGHRLLEWHIGDHERRIIENQRSANTIQRESISLGRDRCVNAARYLFQTGRIDKCRK